MTNKVSPWCSLAAILVLASIVLLQGLVFDWKPVDDAYISFRYAANLLDGHGLVFNPGERVEGYTNFLWTMLMAACGLCGLNIVQAGMWSGVLFACIAIVLTLLVSKQIAVERQWPGWLAWVPPLLIAFYPGWSYWAFSGMEPPLLACLLLLFLYFGWEGSSNALKLGLCAFFGILAALTRWDLVLIWPVVVIALLLDGNQPRSRRLTSSIILSSCLLIGFGSYFVWRTIYYGDIMPNTYYAKTGGSFLLRIPRGLVYTGELAVCWWLPVSLVLWTADLFKKKSAVLFASLLIYMVYVTWTGGDHFAWLRFYMPVLPIAAIMAAGIVKNLSAFAGRSKFRRATSLAVVAGFLAVFVGTSMRIDYLSAQKHHQFVRWWQNVGIWSKDAFPRHYRYGVIPAGIIPYLSGHPVLDLMGLTDHDTAHFGEIDTSEAPGHQKSSTDIVLKQKPEVILGEALPFDHPPTQQEVLLHTHRNMLLKLYQMPSFKSLYDFRTVKIGNRYTSYWILN